MNLDEVFLISTYSASGNIPTVGVGLAIISVKIISPISAFCMKVEKNETWCTVAAFPAKSAVPEF